ncbi:hypothetical protein FQA39_LY17101 [Lamprigera yunnana]|nr:hypothetical protein FQA39_LY17101 [Lamprigera yunnana]
MLILFAATASRSDKCSQTAVDVRNISAQTHSFPTVNKLAGSNLIKMRKKHDVACNKKINSIQNVTNKSLFEELKEILPPIQINHDSTSPTSVSSIHVSQKKSSAQKTTPRILILADSHGRKLANKFRDRLSPNYSVLCIFKPNATFEQTTSDFLGLTLDFHKGDHVIIMAGTNDALVKNYISDNSIEKTVARLSHTNCLFVAVPYVYHCNYRYFNKLAYKTNYQFQFIANNYSESVKFVDVNRFLGSRHKTLNGLHLNDKDDSDEDMVHASDDNTTDDETLSPQVIAYLEEEETVDELNLSLTEVCYSPLKFHALGECSSELLMLNRN